MHGDVHVSSSSFTTTFFFVQLVSVATSVYLNVIRRKNASPATLDDTCSFDTF